MPAHNRRDVTQRCVESLAAQTYPDFHLVLIDDGSTDGTADMVLLRLPKTTVLRGDGTWWWAGSLQQGYQWLTANADGDDLVLILNDDTTFEPEFIARAVKVLQERKRTLLLAQAYNAETGRFVEAGVAVDWRRLHFAAVSDPRSINCFSTRGLFLRVCDMREIGGFHPVLLPHYASDYEYTIRAHRKGFALASSPDVRIWFTEHTTGVRSIGRMSLLPYLRTIFSKRALQNPLYWTAFVLFSSPWRYVPINLVRVWMGFFRQTREVLARPTRG